MKIYFVQNILKNIIIILSTLLIMFGCTDNPGISELQGGNGQLLFVSTISDSIQLLSDDKIIEGDNGGEFNFEFSNSDIAAKGILDFPESSFQNQERIFVSVPEAVVGVAALDLNPIKLKFEKPIFLTLKFSGLNIKEGDIINFNCINKEGDMVDVEYRKLIIDYDDGWALVVNAKLYMFSRVGFTRRIENWRL